MSSSDDDFDSCEDDEMETFNYICLMCESNFNEIEKMLSHAFDKHNFNLKHILKSVIISNEYDWIKIVNFIRQHNKNLNIDDIKNGIWKSDDYLKPVIDDDNLLFIDYDIFQTNSIENGDRITELENELSRCMKTIEMLRNKVTDLLECKEENVVLSTITKSSKLNDEDRAYFTGYSHYSIHDIMIKDKIRTESYRKFIEENGREYFKNKIILDIGCGTGILSMFAARAGAAHVYGIDCADIIYDAMAIVEKNGLKEKITLIHGKLEDTDLPCDKVDVVISEWMGYFLIYESMLDSVLYGCRKYLNPSTGLVFPRYFTLNIVGADLSTYRHRSVDCWDSVFGFDMSSMKMNVMKEVIVDIVPIDDLVTDVFLIRHYDVQQIAFDDNSICPQNIDQSFELVAVKSGKLGAIVAYFDTFFTLPDQLNGLMFSTGPGAVDTHWQQTILLLNHPIDVIKGEKIRGFLRVGRHKHGDRGLNFSLTINDNIHQKFEFS